MARAMTREVLDVYPLTPAQQGILAETLASQAAPAYLQQHVLEITGIADPEVLRQAFAGLVARHDALRTAFVWDVADQPLQVVRHSAEVALTLEDVRGAGAGVIAARQARLLAAETRIPFDLQRPPLLRVRALRTGDVCWLLIVTHHHLVLDGWSVSLLHGELAEMLAAIGAGREPRLPAPRPFREFVTWQRDKRDADADAAYLCGLLGSVTSATPLGSDLPPAGWLAGQAGTTAGPVTVFRPITGDDHPALAARRAGVRPSAVVHAAWALLLARWSGRQDVVFGTAVAGRPGELDGAGQRIGMFLNTAVLRVGTSGEAPAGAWLRQVQESLDRSRRHEHAPLALAVRSSAVPPGAPLLTSVLAFQNYWRPEHGDIAAGDPAGAAVRLRVISRAEQPGLPLTVAVALPDEGVWVRVGYDPAQVGRTAAQSVAETFASLVTRLAAVDPSTPLASIPAGPSAPPPRDEPPARELMDAMAARLGGQRADAVVTSAAGALTGPDLLAAVRRTEARLRPVLKGLAAPAVAVCAPPGLSLVTGLLATLACGAVPVLADPYLPAAELPVWLAGRPVLIPEDAVLAASPASPVVRIAGPAAGAEPAPGGRPALAHPGQRALAFGAELIRGSLRLTADDVVLAVLVAEDPVLPSLVLAAIAAGCRLELREPGAASAGLAGEPVAVPPAQLPTVLVAAAPTAIRLLDGCAPGARIVLSGEPPAPDAVECALASGRAVWRLWASGRTGGADACTELRRPAEALLLGPVPGGMAADDAGQPVPPGGTGELVIVRPAGPCQAGIRVRSAGLDGGLAVLEQLGRGSAGELALTGHLLGLDGGIAAATVTMGPGGEPHAWVVPAGGADALAAARAAAAALPARARPVGYTTVPELPIARHGGTDTDALTAALQPARQPAPAARRDQVLARLDALPPEIREAFTSKLRSLAARTPAPASHVSQSAWQRVAAHDQARAEHLAYWRQVLDGAQAAAWPVPPYQAGPAETVQRPAAAATESEWIAAAATALALLSGTEDVLLGVVLAPGTSNGPAVSQGLGGPRTLPLRVSAGGGQPFAVTVAAVTSALRAARSHADIPGTLLDPLLPGPFALSVLLHQHADGPARHDEAAIVLSIAPGVLTARHTPHLAHHVDAGRLADLTVGIAEAGTAGPERKLLPADLTGAGARAELLRLGDGGQADHRAPVTVGDAILARAAASPEATAVEAPDGVLSYGELVTRARAMAARLGALGVGPEDRVAVCLPRQAAMVWAPLAVMLAGAAYVPLDPDHPDERLRLVLVDACVRHVLTTATEAGRFPAGLTVVAVGTEGQDELPAAEAPAALPQAAAYVLYTSGSTGQPKGVLVEQRAVASFCAHIARAYHIGPGTRLLAFAAPTFDVSVFELWAGLSAGATVVLAGSEERQSPEALQRLLAGKRVTCAELPPSIMPLLDPGYLPDLRLVSVGGEAPAGNLVDTWATGEREFWNGYGPTETTVAVTLMRCHPPSGGRVPPIGLPMAGHRAYVLDESGRLVPPGVPGELCVAGPGLARGYLGMPGQTATSFVADPYGPPGTRMYRTGDLARWTASGVLEFLGRADRQVKIRGFRVEPAEVEAALAGHPAVRQVTVQPWDAPDGTRHLAAYVVPADGQDPPSLPGLRATAAGRLPAHMLPTRLAVLPGLPLTPAGKVDRKALPEPVADSTPASDMTEWSQAERILAQDVIGPLIGVASPGRDEGFFELGGNSIQAAQVTARVRDTFGTEISLVDFFREPTVAGLAKLVDRARPGAAGRNSGPEGTGYRMTDGATLPLSYPQATLYAACQADGDLPGYHAPMALRLRGPLNLNALHAAFGWLTERHAPLRVIFTAGAGGPVQTVRPPASPSFEVSDVPDEAPEARERLLRQAVGAAAAQPFDLANGPLLRVRVHRLADGDHVLQWTIHHLVTDGWSTGVQLDEIGTAYHAFAAGQRPALPPLVRDYGDFISWHRGYVASQRYAADLDWWRRNLAGLPADLRLARPPGTPEPDCPAVTRFRHGWRNLRLPDATATGVRQFTRAHGVTLFMTCLAVQAILIGAETGSDDVLVLTPHALRVRSEWEHLVGWFANPLALRLRLPAGQTFAELTAHARQVCTAAFAHGHVPFELLRAELGLPAATLTAQSSVMNAPPRLPGFRGFAISVAADDSGRDFTPVMEVYSPPGTRYQFSVVLRERHDGTIAGGLEFDASAVAPAVADRWHAAFLSVLAAGTTAPGTAVAGLARLARDPRAVGRVS
ncbi:MAG TPA: amino acid adenylation domain-containing protein [Streptosporangiaceae bacterium]|nr:amino acid adenylation domain-containing protein [Streptosporangiaceae bacterium]